MRVPEQHRLNPSMNKRLNLPTELVTESYTAGNGAFIVPAVSEEKNKPALFCIATSGMGWEHVSISPLYTQRTPTWEEMCYIKSLFWDDEEEVMQLHPPKSQWVNNHPYVLHLWRPIGGKIPLPPSLLVGKKEMNVNINETL